MHLLTFLSVLYFVKIYFCLLVTGRVKGQSHSTNEPFSLRIVYSSSLDHLGGAREQKVDKNTRSRRQTLSKSVTKALCGLNYRPIEQQSKDPN